MIRGFNISDPLTKYLKRMSSTIIRPIINHDHLAMAPCLIQHALNRLADLLLAVLDQIRAESPWLYRPTTRARPVE